MRGTQNGSLARRRRDAGFSLLEITLVAFAIGILLAGMLSARELITQAEIKSVVTELNGVLASYHAYIDRYASQPGDDARAAQRWAGAQARNGDGDGRISGTYEAAAPAPGALPSFTIDTSQGEALNFWWHLRLADLIAPAVAGRSIASQPQNAFGGLIGVQMDGAGLVGLTMCESDLPPTVAEAVDAQLDDLQPHTGLLRAALQTERRQPLASAASVSRYEGGSVTARYIVCRTR